MESDIGKITFTWLSSLSLPSILIGLGAAALVAKLVRAQQAKGAYWARITARRAQLAERRRNLEEILLIGGVLVTPEREEILRLGIEELLARLKSDQLHPVAVLQAYQAKAVAVNEEINAVCDFILEATEQAEALALLPPEERGPLHGLPLSVKECFLLAGYDSTIGMGKLIGLKSPKDCSVIEMLKAQGAVPFCLTNVPQTMVSFGCSNPVYGTTKNPHKLDRTPGGSSGGEGALLAAGGSILGLGSDLGGSVRVPAHMSGVCGLKPTSGRIFEGGRRGGVGSGGPVVRNGVYGVSGFMSSSVKGLEVGMMALLEGTEKMAALDWRVAPVPWRNHLANPGRPLKIGFYTKDGIFPPTPGMSRAVQETVDLLKKAGHEVEEWTPPCLEAICNLWLDFGLADQGYFFTKTMANEHVDQSMRFMSIRSNVPKPLHWLVSFFLPWVSPSMAEFWTGGAELTRDLWLANGRKDAAIYKLTRAWEEKV